MKKQWRPYGVDVKLIGHGLKKIIDAGNKRMITQNKIDETARLWNETKNPKYKKQWI